MVPRRRHAPPTSQGYTAAPSLGIAGARRVVRRCWALPVAKSRATGSGSGETLPGTGSANVESLGMVVVPSGYVKKAMEIYMANR